MKHRRQIRLLLKQLALRRFWDEVLNYRRRWSSSSSLLNREQTSLTDEGNFLGAVAEILDNPDKVKIFRSNESIRRTYDHVSYDQGLASLINIRGRGQNSLVRKVADLSDFGKPAIYHYPQLGRFSPTVLRYAKFALDLKFFFPEIAELDVCEIGVGFGGQAVTLNKFFGVSNFTFFDLPEVNQLANLCVKSLAQNINLQLKDGRYPSKHSCGLVISNYAFSEMSPSVQSAYLENVVLESPRGFMAYNSLSEEQLGGYSAVDLSKSLPQSMILPEDPASNEKNVLLVWGSDRGLD